MILAHGAIGPAAAWQTWQIDLGLIMTFVVGGAVYVFGVARLRSRASRISPRRILAGIGALFAAVVALMGPVEAAAHDLFAAHMVQHLVLILLIAPLLIAARPLRVIGSAASLTLRRRSVAWAEGSLGRALRSPLVVGSFMVSALAAWHAPPLYEAALRSQPIHVGEHASFLVAALAFWAAVLGRRPAGTRAALTFAVFLFSGALGALMTFSGTVLYPGHGGGPSAWGLTPLEDQQLAGVIMWIPSGASYVVAFGALFIAWMSRLEARMPSRPKTAKGAADG